MESREGETDNGRGQDWEFMVDKSYVNYTLYPIVYRLMASKAITTNVGKEAMMAH